MPLEAPWIREQIIEALQQLADQGWLASAAVTDRQERGDGLDAILDVLDDTGALDEPSGRVGWSLRDEVEAGAMDQLGRAMDAALGSLELARWRDVSDAAGIALDVLLKP